MFRHFATRQRKYSSKQIGGFAIVTGIVVIANLDRAPYSNRVRLILIPQIMEQQLADAAYKETYANTNTSRQTWIHSKVSGITQKIIMKNKCLKDLQRNWKVHIVNDSSFNAFVLPNGSIFVHTGVFKVIDNDSELAAILAHELAHVVARHSAESMSFQYVVNGIAILLGFNGFSFLLENKYSQTLEYEADLIGLHLMSKACYDPSYAANIWEKMQKLSKDTSFNFLSTHPTHSNRLQYIIENLPKLGDWEKDCSTSYGFFNSLK